MFSWTLFTLWATIVIASAVPVSNRERASQPDQCAPQCSGYSKFKYDPGTTYMFDYSVTTTTEVKGSSEEAAKLKLDAKAEIEVISACEFGLSLNTVQLSHSDGMGRMTRSDREYTFRQSLEKSVLRFSFEDGVINQVCPNPEEPAWVVNIKRGVLSVFQNGMTDWNRDENRTETDVAGTCKTKYSVYSSGYFTTVVKREKDILSCTDRHNVQAMYQMAPYSMDSELQSLPIMKTTHECSHSIQTKGLISRGACTETHVYRPFSNGKNGASTTVETVLVSAGERSGIKTRQTAIIKRTNLLFEHNTITTNPDQARQIAESKLVELCTTTREDIRPETPQLFGHLVSSVRLLRHSDMEILYRSLTTNTICKNNPRGKKFFMDALPMAPTPASIRMMAALMSKDEITGRKARTWLASLAFVQTPTKDMLREVMALLYNAKSRKDAMLPVSSMVYNFCKNKGTSPTPCSDVPEVDAVMTSLMKGHSQYCDTRGDKLGQTLLLLRSLGNAGYHSKVVDAINKCMTSRYSTLEAKVTAAQAFRRMPCEADNSMLWRALSDKKMDSELRIAAYLSLMRCPDQNLDRLAAILNDEKPGHVGAFMYSHMTNLKESSNPHKEALAAAISRLKLEKVFNSDPTNTSMNFEKSFLINKLNTGFTSDVNLIWSDPHQGPFSVATNISVELFGHSINVLDIGGRFAGVKHLARAIVYGNPKKKSPVDTFEMSSYGRVFGNEVMFNHYQSSQIPFPDTSKWMDNIIKLATPSDYSFTQSLNFMDTGMVIPTAAGLPLSMCVNGTAILDVNLSGKLDLRKVAAKPRSLTVDGEISPSAAIEMNGVMAVDAYGSAQTTLRLWNVMHTSTAIKGRIQLERGQQFSVEMELPRDKMEIFQAKSEFFLGHNKVEKSLKMVTDNRKEIKLTSGDVMTKATGVELVGEASFPNASMKSDSPYFPMTGPASFKLVMNKKDTQSGYKLFIKRVENKKSSSAQILFNTPGSKVDRKILLDVSVDYPKKELEVKAISPWMKATFKGNAINTAILKSLSGDLIVDEKRTYGLVSEVKVARGKTTTTLTPKFEVRRPGKPMIVLSGIINKDNKKTIDSSMTLAGLEKDPYLFKVKVSDNKKEKSLYLSLTPPGSKKDYALDTKIMGTDLGKRGFTLNHKVEVRTPVRSLANTGLTLDYRKDKMLKMDGSVEVYRMLRRSTLTASINKVTKKSSTRYSHDVRLKSPKLSGRFQGQTSVKGTKLIATRTTLDYTMPRKYQNKILMTMKYSDRSTKTYSKYNVKSGVTFKKNPEYNVALQAAVDVKKRLAATNVAIKYGPNSKDKNKHVTVSGSIKKNVRSWKNANFNYKAKAEAPEFNVDVSVNGKHAHTPKMIDSSMQMVYSKGKTIKMGVNLKDQSSKRKKINGMTYINMPGRQYTLTSSLIENSPTQMTHSISLTDKQGAKNQISTVVNIPRNKPRTFVSNVKLDGMKPVFVSGFANLDPKNFKINGEFKHAKDMYMVSTTGKYAPKLNRGKLAVALQYPSRKVTMALDGGIDTSNKINYDANVEVNWDANRKKSKSKMSAKFNHLHKMTKELMSLNSMFEVKTPFKHFENVGSSFRYLSDPTRSDIKAKVTGGSKSKEISTNLNVKKPFNVYNAVATMSTNTPFRGFQQVQVEVNHKLDSTLSTVLKTMLEKRTAELMFTGEDKGDRYRSDLNGNLVLKSNIPNLESVTVIMSHSGDYRNYKTSSALNHNGDKYTYDMNVEHSRRGWSVRNKGDVTIVTPKRKMSSTWKHKNSENDMDTSIASKWDNNVFDVKVTGLMQDGPLKTLDTSLVVRSPWNNVRDLNFKFNGNYGKGILNHKALWHRNGQKEASSDMNYVRRGNTVNFDAMVTSPYNEDLTTKMSVDYQTYPVTGTAMIQWSPRQKVTMTGSAVTKSWDNADLNLKVTTPFSLYRNVVWKASSKKDKYDNVLTTGVDTGVRQWANVETRFRVDNQVKMAKFKMMSSHANLKSIETGFQLEGETMKDFNGKVDFEAQPHVDKISAMFVLTNQETLRTKIYIFTPFEVMPSFESTLTYEKAASQHVTRLKVEYPTMITGTIETSIKTDLPINFNTKITSNNPAYNNIGFSLQHDHSERKINSHAEVTYTPGKKVELDIIGSRLPSGNRYGGVMSYLKSNVEGSVMVRTPFRDYKLSKAALRHKWVTNTLDSHAEYTLGKHKLEVDGSFKQAYTNIGAFTMSSTIPGAEKIRWTLKKRGSIGNMKLDSLWIRNKEKVSLGIVNKIMKKSISSSLVLTSPYMEMLKVQLKHKENPDTTMVEKITATYGKLYSLDTEGSFFMKNDVITANTMIKTRQGRQREMAGMSFSKSGPMNNFNIEAKVSRNMDALDLKGKWKHGDEIDTNFDLKTPFENYRDLTMNLKHTGSIDDFKTETSVTYMDDQTIDGKIEFSHSGGKKIILISEFTTPFDGYESMNLKVTNNNNLMDGGRYSTPNVNGVVQLTTTIGRFGFSNLKYSINGRMNNFVAEVEAMKNRENLINLKALTKTSYRDNSFRASVDFKTVWTKDMTYVVERVGNPKDLFSPRFSGVVKLSALGMVDKTVYAVNTEFNKRGTLSRGAMETSIEVVTPIRDYESIKFNYKHVGDRNGFKCFSTLEYGNSKRIEYELQAIAYPTPKYVVSVKTPYRDYKEMKSEIVYDFTGPKYSLNSDVNAGKGYIFTLTGNLDTSQDIKGNVFLTTPFRDYTDLSATLLHTGDSYDFNSNFKVVYMNRKNIRGGVKFNRKQQWREIDLTAELYTPFRDMQRTRVTMKHKQNGYNVNPMITSSGTVEYGYRKKIEGKMELTYDPNLDLKIDVKTPFRAYKTVKIISKTEGSSYKSFKGMGSVIINRYDTYTSNVNWNFKTWKYINGFVNVYTTNTGMTQVSHTHDVTDRNMDADTSLEYDNGKVIKAEIKTTFYPVKQFNVRVKTPYEGYKDMKGAFMYSNSYQNYVTENTIDLGEGQIYNLKSAVDYASDQTSFSANIITPIAEFQAMDVKMTHTGSIDDFTTYVYFYMPQTEIIEGTTTMRYKGLFDTSLSSSLKSSMDGMDDMKLDMKTSDLAGEKKMTTALQWTEGKTIMSSMLYRQQSNRWNGDKYHTDFSLTTPFKRVESVSMQLDQVVKDKAYEEKFVFEMNGDQLWDMDLNLGYENDEPRIEATLRQPWPMQLTTKTSLQGVKKEGEIYVNWDRDDTESNINVQVSRSMTPYEQSFSLEVTHPSRTVGVSHKVIIARGLDTYEGKLYWNSDDDSQLSYNVQMKDGSSGRRSRGRTVKEGLMTVGLPGRTMSLVGTYSGQGTNHGLDTTFSWDAGKDTSKKMEIQASLSGIRPRKGDIIINMPSINKEIKLEGELTTSSGRTILDTRTDFSYSQDARKTLTLTSKIEDIKDYKSDFNYSLSLGISHPYTRVDIQMNSHIGTSKEKTTLGAKTMYLTARKQMKNMALFAEIDKIKKTLNVQTTNPMHQMTMTGKVVSEKPYKILMINKLDEDTLMKWDVTIDYDKKAFLINTYYNADGRVAVSAMYPNSTAVKAAITRHTPMNENREVLIGLNLLTPRLLHTSLQWRPGVIQEMTQYNVDKIKTRSDEMLTKWKNVNKEIIEELSAKYTAIVNAVSEEVKPILEDINMELKQGEQQISGLLRRLDDFYRNNNLYNRLGENGKKAYLNLRQSISEFSRDYKDFYTRVMRWMLGTVEEWKNYDMKSVHLDWLNERHQAYRSRVYSMARDYQGYVDNIDSSIEELEERGNEIIEQVKSNPYVKTFNNRINQIQNMDVDMSGYIPDVDLTYYPQAVADWGKKKMSEVDMSLLTKRPEARYVHKGLNEVYQQGRWAYNYWGVKDNLKKHAKTLIHQLKMIVQDEMKGHLKIIQAMNRNPVTVWLPMKGLVEMEIPLPLPVHRLDEMPDWSSYADTMDMDFSMVKSLAKNVKEYVIPSSLFSNTSTTTTTTNQSTGPDVAVIVNPPSNPNSRRYPTNNRRRGGRRSYVYTRRRYRNN